VSEFVVPPPVEPGDEVAILSPSSNLAEFPYVYEQGLERLRDRFGLEPVEYPTARKDSEWLYDHPERRARDVMDAFADPEVSAAIATIGGNDQIRILEHLDPSVLRENPTRFFGWSDNTVLSLYLFELGIVSFSGGSLLAEYAMNGEMFDYDVEYLERALFEDSVGEIRPAERFTDEPNGYGEGPSALETPRETRPNPGWRWENGDEAVEGRVWGGCWGIVDQWFLHDQYVPDADRLEGTVLAVETSEERPNPGGIAGQLRALGERGLLERFDGFLVGRATATSHVEAPPVEERDAYRERQREVWTDLLAEYNPDAPVVLDVDFGHTYPGVPVPIGGTVRIDPDEGRIVFR